VRISNEKKAVIHVAKQQLHMAEEDYRTLLRQAAGVESSSDLDEAGFTTLMATFERLGFRSTKGRAQQARREGMASAAQIGKIRALWQAYTGKDNESALGHWLEKHFHVSHVRFLEGWRAGKAIAILKKMSEHPNAKRQRRGKTDEAQSA
jgi:phage gp16-like protein